MAARTFQLTQRSWRVRTLLARAEHFGVLYLWDLSRFKKITLHLEDRYSNREAFCILYGGSQCAPSYETGVIKVIDGSNEITDVNGGIVCGQCRGDWKIVVNNADPIPDAEGFQGKNFSSYNAASVNMGAFVVFRARSTGGGNPSTGIFVRDMLGETSGIVRQAGRREQPCLVPTI